MRTEAILSALLFKQLASGSHPRRSGGRFSVFLLTLLFVAPAMAATFQAGDFVQVGRACTSAADADRLVSNGHSVSPPGQTCRVVSRQSSGGYYPIFNERCTGGAEEYRMDVHVSAPDRISVRDRAGATVVAYRHCPSRAAARGGN